MEYSKIGMQFMIIGVRYRSLGPKWLGATFSKDNVEDFLTDVPVSGIDPCGEYGEYHSLIVQSDNLGNSLKWSLLTKDKQGGTNYLILKGM